MDQQMIFVCQPHIIFKGQYILYFGIRLNSRKKQGFQEKQQKLMKKSVILLKNAIFFDFL